MSLGDFGQAILVTGRGVLLAVVPLAVLFLIFQVFVLRLPRREVSRILTGTLVASLGLFLFLLGVEVAYLPFGRSIGEALGAMPRKWLLAPMGFVLGFVTAWGEPAVHILAKEVESASSGSIRRSMVLWAISIGVGGAVAAGLLRIGYGIPLLLILVPGYLLVMAALRWADERFVAVALDAGGVATGPLANTFLLAMALGAASAAGDADTLVQGLGLVALIALAPVVSLVALGLYVRSKTRPKE